MQREQTGRERDMGRDWEWGRERGRRGIDENEYEGQVEWNREKGGDGNRQYRGGNGPKKGGNDANGNVRKRKGGNVKVRK